MAKCDLKYLKYFAPKRVPSNLSSKQLDKLNTLTDVQAGRYMKQRDYLNDESSRALEILAQIAPQRFARTTNLGRPTLEVMEEARQNAEKLARETSDDINYLQEAGENILTNFRKGNPMSMEERALAYPAFINTMDKLPLLLKQISYAKQSGNNRAATLLGMEMVKSMAIIAGFFGDINALSVGFNSLKYMNKQIKEAQTIRKLFQNGEC